MFLRANKRFKDGKMHRYWSVVESRRVAGGGSVQKTLLYLGEINDSDRASWTRAIEALDEREQTRQIHLFPEDRTPDPLLEHPTLRLRLSHLKDRWAGFFGATYDILLYDLTSTYFEVDANGPDHRSERTQSLRLQPRQTPTASSTSTCPPPENPSAPTPFASKPTSSSVSSPTASTSPSSNITRKLPPA